MIKLGDKVEQTQSQIRLNEIWSRMREIDDEAMKLRREETGLDGYWDNRDLRESIEKRVKRSFKMRRTPIVQVVREDGVCVADIRCDFHQNGITIFCKTRAKSDKELTAWLKLMHKRMAACHEAIK